MELGYLLKQLSQIFFILDFPYACHFVWVSALENPHFIVSMETDQKMTDSEIKKKFAGPLDSNLQGVWLQILTPSWPN